MRSTWDESALTLESIESFEGSELWSTLAGEGEAAPGAVGWAGLDPEDEASVGQWLSNIGQGAATGAATGMAAGPWGALVGGLLGGGLGAVQTAMAPQPPAPASPPRTTPARPAPAGPVARPAARPPATPTTGARTPTPSAQTSQLLNQLATLVPVVAALAVQVGQLTQGAQNQGAQNAPEAVDDETAVGQVPRDHGLATRPGEQFEWGASGEDAFDEGGWPQGAAGEWLGAEDRDDGGPANGEAASWIPA